ncbi:PorP/SprF family type IX secretion system membrane protein [Paracrocinitomix mangrovi]|uniref:PorP/SprF family type IX secretion system membrane protein n=1 Tax=Paracrocinitomix mangrovi TaxID=2862509 RepID=UPI001C8DDF1C|nr:PorP/SprF family type IX secretion system membrane protein [Paracrocinitomix mangrovi]UKN01525.1 PorP/SprF family type IX secretion system membrane protein [Paracrocinitomix mangrovi]
MNIPENFDRWMFDYMEGNLSGAEKEAFESFLIQNPDFGIEAEVWKDAFIENEEFVYPHADKLEKDNKVVGIYYWSAAAAAILLLIGFTIFFNNNNEVENQTASQESFDINSVDVNRVADIDATHQSAHDQLVNQDNINEEISIERNDLINVNDNSQQFNNDGSLADNGLGQNHQIQLNQQSHLTAGGFTPIVNEPNMNKLSDLSALPSVSHDPLDMVNHNLKSINANQQLAISQEFGKFEGDEHTSKYADNPDGKSLEFDVAKKEAIDFDSWDYKWKKFKRKVESAFDVSPTNLTNLGDPEILLPNTSVIGFNPGFTGGFSGYRFETNYRNQWFGSDQNSQQMTMSFDKYVPGMRGGVGIVLNAKDYGYGAFGDYNMSLIYSPKILVGKNVLLEPAVKLTLGALNANGNQLSPESNIELDRGRILGLPAAQQMSGSQQLWYKDYGLGLVVNAKKFYAGFSADNLNHHFENVFNEEGYATPTSSPIRLNGIVGVDFEKEQTSGGQYKPLTVSPFFAYQQYGEDKQLWGGFNFRYDWFTIGGSISHNLDFTGAIGMKFNKFKLVYHYDQITSSLAEQQIGSHNISLRFNGDNSRKRRFL